MAPLAALIAADAVTRLAALLLLSQGRPIVDAAPLQLVLRLNNLGLGTSGLALVATTGLRLFLVSAFAWAGFAVALILVRRLNRGRAVKVAICVGAYLATALVAYQSSPLLGGLSPYAAVAVARGLLAFTWLTIWASTSSRFWRLGFLLLASTALANFASLIIPPFAIVDFMYSGLVNRVLGMGVFNLADVYYVVAFPVIGVAMIDWLMRAIGKRKKVVAVQTDRADARGVA